MNLENYAAGGVPGRVCSWIEQKENELVAILEEGIDRYISKNTDPYVLDSAPLKNLLLLRIPFYAQDKTQYKPIMLKKSYPAVPCIQSLESTTSTEPGGNTNCDTKVFPLPLLEERYKDCAELITRLVQCQSDYVLSNQKNKKAIFQTLFSEDDADLAEILEDET